MTVSIGRSWEKPHADGSRFDIFTIRSANNKEFFPNVILPPPSRPPSHSTFEPPRMSHCGVEKGQNWNSRNFSHCQRSAVGSSILEQVMFLITPLMQCRGFEKFRQLIISENVSIEYMEKHYPNFETLDAKIATAFWKNDRIASGAPIRRKADDRSKSEDGKQGDYRQLLAKGKCSKDKSCSFKHGINKKGEGQGKRDRRTSPEPRSPSKGSKDGKRCSKRKSPER